MAETPRQKSYVPLLSVILGLVVLIALVAFVLMRSSAQSIQNVNQSTNSSPTYMSLSNQALTQDTYNVGGINDATPPNTVHLTPGSLSTPIHLTATITNNNGVNTVLVGRAGASLHVIAVHGSTAQTTSCVALGLDGSDCWDMTVPGTQFVSSGVLIPASSDPNETSIAMDVPITLPHFALDGTWTVYWKLVPTDAAGNSNTAYALDNSGVNTLRTSVDKLVAIDVSANDGTTATYTAVGGGPIQPLQASAPVSLVVNQKGNVQLYDKIYGTDWTNGTNGQTMPVSITHFLGTTLDSYNASGSQVLVSGGPSSAIQVNDKTLAAWIVSVSTGTQDNTVTALGTNHYQTMIMPSAGRTGSFTATLTNIAADASSDPGGKMPINGGAGGQKADITSESGQSSPVTGVGTSGHTPASTLSSQAPGLATELAYNDTSAGQHINLHYAYTTDVYVDPSSVAWTSGSDPKIGDGLDFGENVLTPMPFKATIDDGAHYVDATLITSSSKGNTFYSYQIPLSDLVGSSPTSGTAVQVKIHASTNNGISYPAAPTSILTVHFGAAPSPAPTTLHWVTTDGVQHWHDITDGYSLSLASSTTVFVGVTGPTNRVLTIPGVWNTTLDPSIPSPSPETMLVAGTYQYSMQLPMGTNTYEIHDLSTNLLATFTITMTP